MQVERLLDAPIIYPGLHASIGENIQGPSLIRTPDWLPNRLGRYYLYFADHKGAYIRLAFADTLLGPWQIHVPGSLQLSESHFPTEPPPTDQDMMRQAQAYFEKNGTGILHDLEAELRTPHIASPDVHVDEHNRRIVMYFHGLEGFGHQVSRVATSTDGLHFEAREEILGKTYMRAFNHAGYRYLLAMPGQFYRSTNPLSGFEGGPKLFNENMRHAAVVQRGDSLWVFWTQVGHAPERILLSTIDLNVDWQAWQVSEPVEVMRPERPWEGADAPCEPSVRSVAYGLVNQLRDPAIYVEGDDLYLLYAVGGESGIGIARIIED